MREISADRITQTVARLCMQANYTLPEDIRRRLDTMEAMEDWPSARAILEQIKENYRLAEREQMPICQDTGMACVFLDIGQDVHIGGDLQTAVDEGVRLGYREGYLRKSVVADPLRRENTGDNTPAMLTCRIVPGDRLGITVAPKGFGSENMSAVKMLRPSDGVEGVKAFVLDTVRRAGPNACPPVVVGVGIGGTFDKVALLAKTALLRSVDTPHEDPFYADLETQLLEAINALGIGAQGLGGRTTALGVNIEVLPTHIAGLPVAVNMSCHVTRHAREVL